MLLEMKLEEFLHLLASDLPTPGGGSVAGLANSLSAALLQMFCKISLKSANEEEQELFQKIIAETKEILKKVSSYIDEDAKAFDKVMAAYKLPKDTEQEKETRRIKIQEALYEAALIPLENAKYAVKLIEISKELQGKGIQGALSDWKCAIYMAKAAFECAKENVLINLDSLKDEEKKKYLVDELSNLSIEGM